MHLPPELVPVRQPGRVVDVGVPAHDDLEDLLVRVFVTFLLFRRLVSRWRVEMVESFGA